MEILEFGVKTKPWKNFDISVGKLIGKNHVTKGLAWEVVYQGLS